MRKKIISVILGLFVGASSFLVFFVPTAQAVVPIGFAQAALASYVSSTGYKMYQDQAVGDSILLSLSELYDLFRENTLQGAATDFALDTLLTSFQIRQDTSGNVVISKMAADVFQQFSDWLETEYNVPVGVDTPTQIVAPSSGPPVLDFPQEYSVSGAGTQFGRISTRPYYKYLDGVAACCFVINGDGWRYPVLVGTDSDTVKQTYNHYPPGGSYEISAVHSTSYNGHTLYYTIGAGFQGSDWNIYTDYPVIDFTGILTLTQDDMSPLFDAMRLGVTSTSVKGLAVTLAKDVVDQAAKAGEDDAVVIGVGAQAGATAQEIADLIAQGINARTLDPSVTVVAEVAIDTPVQQFPDQDDLGLPKLGLALVRRFPFCIPFDLVDTWQAIVHAPVPPTMTIDLIPASIKAKIGITADTSFILNLASPAFATLLFILRWACIISFCLALEQLTKRYIWTTGG